MYIMNNSSHYPYKGSHLIKFALYKVTKCKLNEGWKTTYGLWLSREFCLWMNGAKRFRSSRFQDIGSNELCANTFEAFVTALLKMLFWATICSFLRQVLSNFSDRNFRLIQIPTDMATTRMSVIRLSIARMRPSCCGCCSSVVVVGLRLLVFTAVGGEILPLIMSVTVTR